MRRIAAKAALIGSLAVSVLLLASPAYARIKRSLDGAWDAASRSPSQAAAQPAPLMFIANEGQFDSSIKFELNGSGGSIVFTPDSIMIAVQKPGTNPPWVVEGEPSEGYSPTPDPLSSWEEQTSDPEYSIVDITFTGVNPTPQIQGDNLLDTKVSYMLGNDPALWATDVPVYETIVYSDFAPGYDLVVDGSSGTWQWRLVSNDDPLTGNQSDGALEGSAAMQKDEGGELPELALEVEGGDVSLEGGGIVIETEGGNITLPLIEVPEGAQTGEPSVNDGSVESPYTTEDDPGPSPVSNSRKSSGGSGRSNVVFSFLRGFVNGLTQDPANPLRQQYEEDPAEFPLFSSYIGGSMDDIADAVTYGEDGSIYIAGRTAQPWAPASGYSAYLGSFGGLDIFVAKIDPQRQLVFMTFLGSPGEEDCSDITVDGSGNIYVVGSSKSDGFPMSIENEPYQSANAFEPYTDIIVFKLASSGNYLRYSTYLGGEVYERAYDIEYVPGSAGIIYIVGDTTSAPFYPDFQPGGADTQVLFAGFNTEAGGAASIVTVKFYGGLDSIDSGFGLALSPIDNSYWIVGQTIHVSGEDDFPITNGFDDTRGQGGEWDAFIAHIGKGPDYNVITSSFFGGNDFDCERIGPSKECDIAVDDAGAAYITGMTRSDDLSDEYGENPYQSDFGGDEDVFAAKVHETACDNGTCMVLDFWRYIGGSLEDTAYSIAISSEHEVYISGATASLDFGIDNYPASQIPDSTMNNGDAFIVRLNDSGEVTFFTYFGGASTEMVEGLSLLENEEKIVIAGAVPSDGGDFPLVDAVDDYTGAGWEGFVAEISTPLPLIEILSPTDQAMVVSLRPEFQWTIYPGADHYSINVIPVRGNWTNPIRYDESYAKIRTVSVSGNDCEDPTGTWCYKWPESPNPYLPDFESGTYLTINGVKEPDKKIGYAVEISAFTIDGSVISSSETEYFQVPSLGGTWEDYNKTGLCTKGDTICERENPYWNAYDDLFFYWGEAYDIPPSILKAIMIKESATDGGERYIEYYQTWFPPHMGYGYEPGWDWKDHYSDDYYAHYIPEDDGKLCFQPYISYVDEFNGREMDPYFFFLDPQQPGHPGAFIDYHNERCITTINTDNYHNTFPEEERPLCSITDPLKPGITVERPCPYPYDISVPVDDVWAPISIFYYANERKYAGQFSVTEGSKFSLTLIPGCSVYNWGDCAANKSWMPAQFRINASYGLGQIAFWFFLTERENGGGMEPEALYDPSLNVEEMVKNLDDNRCNSTGDAHDLGMLAYEEGDWLPTSWESWKSLIIAYNGGSNKYYEDVKNRERGVRPTPTPGSSSTIIIYPSPEHDYDCNWQSNLPVSSYLKRNNNTRELISSFIWKENNIEQWNNPNERILSEYEFDFGERTGWVENVFWKDPSSHRIGWGSVRIYSDSSKTDLLWQSALFDGIFPYTSWNIARTGMEGQPILLSEWGAGLHSSRFYPIAYLGGEFGIIPVQNDLGEIEEGFFSDGGGLFPYLDGSIAAGRKIEGNLGENEFLVYGLDGSRYILERIISPQTPGDLTPPITQYFFGSQPNEDGWWNSPVTLNLTASDDVEVLLIEVFTDPEGKKVIESPRDNTSLTFSEGRWNLGYRAVDWTGNAEPLHDLEMRIDQTPPEIFLIVDGNTEITDYYSNPIAVDLQAEDPSLSDGSEGSGIQTIEYILDEEDEWTTYDGPFLVEEEGWHQIFYRATDVAGNTTEIQSVEFGIDQTPPFTWFDIYGDCEESNEFYNCPLSVEMPAEDFNESNGTEGSWIDRTEYRLAGSGEWNIYTDPLEFTESGRYDIEFHSIDNVGNIEVPRIWPLWIDLEAPASNASIIGEQDPAGYYAPGAQVIITAEDLQLTDGSEGSGVERIEYSLDSEDTWVQYNGPIQFDEGGVYTVYYRSMDLAGNIEGVNSLDVEIVSDSDPPEIEIYADPLQLWPPNNKLVSVRLFGTAVDMGSGIQSIHIEVIDEYGECQPEVQDILPEDIIDGTWERTIELMASRRGKDKDGRTYTIIITATDNLGNVITKEIEIIVPHDQG